jgi:hypothetical protein
MVFFGVLAKITKLEPIIIELKLIAFWNALGLLFKIKY